MLPLMNSRLIFAGLIVALASCHSIDESETAPAGRDVLPRSEVKLALRSPDFVRHVRPILEAKCVACHTRAAQPGVMSLGSREEALKSGTLGRLIIPGSPETSPFFTRLDAAHAGLSAMPAVGERLSKNEVRILTQWVKTGAAWPAGAVGRLSQH